ncbi:hypothetical protein LZ318_24515 [Saccharopolyspora indica]|uniref:DoxX family protein n=1 Tax=Saccharopolyspora indica TaxID=1229659 RepID=UPI0022EA9FA3|nr:hypothetical protein [Saccharopolyspora indica]MDA3644799.1 hypothetical protein [Saccharopolyspora indica]
MAQELGSGRSRGQLATRGLAALLGGAGVMHFVAPKVFDPIVPRVLPGPARAWTYVSGVAEVGCAGLVAVPRTRRVGGRLAALLFVAVLPANVKMAWDWRTQSMSRRAVAYARVPLQVPLVWWALRVARRGRGR